MDITAIKRKSILPTKRENIDQKLVHKIAIRLNASLHNIISNYLEAMHSINDYKYSSMSDVLRKVLFSIQDK
jgi:hypothetical protein